jgi:hypothetical protein
VVQAQAQARAASAARAEGEAAAAEAARPKACDWFQEKSRRACASDIDCPMAVFDAWFDAAAKSLMPSATSRMKARAFVDASLNTDMMAAGSYETVRVPYGALGDADRIDKRQMRERTRDAFLSDRAFRESIGRIVRQEAKKGRVSFSEAGAYCTPAKVCGGEKAEPVRVSSHLFDGSDEVLFVEGEGGDVFYRPLNKHGATHRPLQVTSCAGADRPPECDAAETTPLERWGQGTLVLRKGAATKDAYKLVFAETGGEYVFRNRATTQRSGEEGKASCAQALCAVRAEECPGTYCSLQGEGVNAACVPRAEKVADVRLL